jgi:hypothetical protein
MRIRVDGLRHRCQIQSRNKVIIDATIYGVSDSVPGPGRCDGILAAQARRRSARLPDGTEKPHRCFQVQALGTQKCTTES